MAKAQRPSYSTIGEKMERTLTKLLEREPSLEYLPKDSAPWLPQSTRNWVQSNFNYIQNVPEFTKRLEGKKGYTLARELYRIMDEMAKEVSPRDYEGYKMGRQALKQLGKETPKPQAAKDAPKELEEVFKNMKVVSDWGSRWSMKDITDPLQQRRVYNQMKTQISELNTYFKDRKDVGFAKKAQVMANDLYKIDPTNMSPKEVGKLELIAEWIHSLQRKRMDNTITDALKSGVPRETLDKAIDEFINVMETSGVEGMENAKWFKGYFNKGD